MCRQQRTPHARCWQCGTPLLMEGQRLRGRWSCRLVGRACSGERWSTRAPARLASASGGGLPRTRCASALVPEICLPQCICYAGSLSTSECSCQLVGLGCHHNIAALQLVYSLCKARPTPDTFCSKKASSGGQLDYVVKVCNGHAPAAFDRQSTQLKGLLLISGGTLLPA